MILRWLHKRRNDREIRRGIGLANQNLNVKAQQDLVKERRDREIWQLCDAWGLATFAEGEAIIAERESKRTEGMRLAMQQMQNAIPYGNLSQYNPYNQQYAPSIMAGFAGWWR